MRARKTSRLAVALGSIAFAPAAAPATPPDLTRYSLVCARILLVQTHATLSQCGPAIGQEQEARYQRMAMAYVQAMQSVPPQDAERFFAGEQRSLEQINTRLRANPGLCMRPNMARMFEGLTTPENEQQFYEALARNGPLYNPPGSCL
jgi:hypothetical protein